MSIGNSAFSDCGSLTSVTIGNGVTSIGDSAFYHCPIVTASIPAIACKAISNIKLENVTITSGESISGGAFYNCSSLISVIIGNGVERIRDSAFINCNSLTSITIGTGVTRIDGYAFINCSKLAEIYYNGTKSQWDKIEKGFNWNGGIENYVVYYKNEQS